MIGPVIAIALIAVLCAKAVQLHEELDQARFQKERFK